MKVRRGLEELLFRLLILGCLSDSHGRLWRRNTSHLVAVEMLLPQKQPNQVEPPSSSPPNIYQLIIL